MITFIRGILAEKTPASAIVDVQGIGYEIHIPISSYERLPSPGEEVCLLTVHHVREDAEQLFGFATEEERHLFRVMLGITGIGPRLALGALSGLSVREITAAVAENDVKRLSSISGIGKKTAERMVIELRDKLDAGTLMEASAEPGSPDDQRIRDTILALVSLGYKQEDAAKMLRSITGTIRPEHTVEDLIRLALTR